MTFLVNPFIYLILGGATSSYYSEVIADSPQYYWRLGEASGTDAIDAMGNSNGIYTGTPILGSTSLLIGDSDTSAYFDGANNSATTEGVELGLLQTDAETILTIEAVIKPGSLINRQVIYKEGGYGNGVALGIFDSNFRIGITSDAGDQFLNYPTTSYAINDILHIVAVITASKLELFINGISVAVSNITVNAHNGACEAEIGRSWCPTGNNNQSALVGGITYTANFEGIIDEVAIYYSELSAARIKAHYDAAFGTSMHTYLYNSANWSVEETTLTRTTTEFIVTNLTASTQNANITLEGLIDLKLYRFRCEAYAASTNTILNAARLEIDYPSANPDGAHVLNEDVWEEIYIEFTATGTTQNIYIECASATLWGDIGDVAKFRNLVLEGQTEILGQELVSNGDFTTDTSGWADYNSTLSAADNVLNITYANIYYSAHQFITLTTGNNYRLQIDKPLVITENDRISIGVTTSNNNGVDIYGESTIPNSGLALGAHKFNFIASTDRYLWLGTSVSSDSGVRKFDNVSVKELTYEGIWKDVDEPASYKYWRIYITQGCPAETYTHYAEIEMRATLGGADQCTGGIATASSEYAGDYYASNAFDDNVSSVWHTNVSNIIGEWIQYEFLTDVYVEEITMLARSTFGARTPIGYILQASNNGVDWWDKITVSDSLCWINSEKRAVDRTGNLLINGRFYDGVEYWSDFTNGGSITWNSGTKTATVSNTSQIYGGANTQEFSVVIGKIYRLTFDASNLVLAPKYYLSISAGNQVMAGTTLQTVIDGVNSYEFTSTVTSDIVIIVIYSQSSSLTSVEIDNVIFREV